MSHAYRISPTISGTTEQLVQINQILIQSNQLDRAFQVPGIFSDKAIEVLEAYVEREGIEPTRVAARALAIRASLFRDLLDQWIEEEDCLPFLEAASAARIIHQDAVLISAQHSFRFDPAHFAELLANSRSKKRDPVVPLPPINFPQR